MSTLATFVSTLGFKMDGSFDQAMQAMTKRMSAFGASMEASAKKSFNNQARDAGNYSKLITSLRDQELKAAEKAAHFDQKERSNKLKWLQQQEALQKKLSNPDAHVYAFRKQQMQQEALHTKALQEDAKRERQSIARDNTIERDKAAAALKYQRVMQQENARITKAATVEMNRMHSEALKENARRDKFQDDYKKNIFGKGFSSGGIGGIPIMGRTTLGMMAGGFGISEFTRQAYQMANFNAQMMPTLKFATKDEKKSDSENLAAAQAEKNYINKEVNRLSLDRVTATRSYEGLLSATYKTLGSQGSQDLFTGIQQVGMMTGRSVDEMHRAIVGFQQIASKKQIMSEEVKGQIAEALLGSEQIFANALEGGDTKKFQAGMKAAKYTEKDLLKVAAEMKRMVSDKDLAEMMHTPEKMMTRMRNSWGDLLTAINDAGFWEMMSAGIEGVTDALKELTPYVKELAPHFRNIFKFLWENKGTLTMFWAGWKVIANGMKVFSTAKAAGEIMTLAKTFRVLGLAMLETVAIPAAIIGAIILAADTMQAFSEHKRGVLFDFRPADPRAEKQLRSNTLTDNLKSFSTSASGSQAHSDAWRGIEGGVQSMRESGQMDEMSLTERHAIAQRVLQATSKEHLSNNTEKYLMDIENEYRGRELQNKDKEKLSRVGGGNNVTINFTGVADPEAIKQLVVPAIQDTLRSNAQRDQSALPNLLFR